MQPRHRSTKGLRPTGRPTEPQWSTFPWNSIPLNQLDKARKLRIVLLPTLCTSTGQGMSLAKIVRAATPHYKAVYGLKVSDRHLRRLIERTIMRDHGREEWFRLELYLDNAAFAKTNVCERTAKPIKVRIGDKRSPKATRL